MPRPLPLDGPTDRREALADWLAGPDNPYFAEAVVNRVWRNFFGRGLIDPEDDLRATNPASDEPLLDWLVADFRAHGHDAKHLIRTIMNSAVYARASASVREQASADPKFLSHYIVKRLPAEVLLDAIARVTDVPTSFPGYPAGWRSLQLPDSKVESTFLASFGRPERLATCSCERSQEPSMAQALHLANGLDDQREAKRLQGSDREGDRRRESRTLRWSTDSSSTPCRAIRPTDERARLEGVLQTRSPACRTQSCRRGETSGDRGPVLGDADEQGIPLQSLTARGLSRITLEGDT